MANVPLDDLPEQARLVPTDDLPSGAVPGDDLPDHAAQASMVAQLTPQQSNEARLGHLAVAPGVPIPAWVEDYLVRAGRRLSEGQDAFYNLPTNIKNIATGGGQGRVDAALRTLQGATYPIAAPIMAGIEAPTEQAAAGLGVPENYAEQAGNWASVPLSVLMGRASNAGKLGTAGEDIAKYMFGVGKNEKPTQADFNAGREVPLSDVIREAPPMQQASKLVPNEEELLAALMGKETPEQVLARRGTVGYEMAQRPETGVTGVYEQMHGRNRFNEAQSAEAMAMGKPYPKGTYGIYDLAPDLVRNQDPEQLRQHAIQMQRQYNPEGLVERQIEQASFPGRTPSGDPLYPGNAPKQLGAKDIENFINMGTTDVGKVKDMLNQAKRGQQQTPVRTVEVGASMLDGNPGRGFWSSLFKGKSSDALANEPSGWGLMLKSLGQESSKMVENLGPSGRDLVGRVRTVYDNYERDLSNFLDGPQGVVHMADKLKLTPKERVQMSAYVEGFEPAMNERVAQVGNLIRAQRQAIAQRATGMLEIRNPVTGRVSPWQERPNYFPHFTDWEGIAKDKARLTKAVQEIQVQTGQKTGKPITMGEAQDIFSQMRRNSRMEYGHLESARLYQLSDYERDAVKAWSKYSEAALKRINESEMFGPRLEIAKDLVAKTGMEGNSDMGQWAAQRYIEQVTGRSLYDKGAPHNPVLSSTVSGIRSVQVAMKLGQAVIANASQSGLTGIVTGYGNLFKGFQELRTQGGKDFARMAGATIEQTMRDMQDTLGAGKLTGKVLQYTGFSKVEQFNRMLAANAGREFAKDLAQKVVNKQGNVEQYKRHLRAMGIEPMDLLASGGKLTQDQELSAARSVIARSQFKVRSQELPLFWSGPMGKLISQFSSFGFKSAKMINDEVVGEARKGNFAPLARFALVTPIIGEGVADIQALVKGKERPENFAARVAENLAAVGTLGLYYDAFRSAQYGEVGVLRRMVGPTLGDLGQLVAGTVGGDPKMLAKMAAQNVPVIGPTLRPALFPPKKPKEQ